MRPFIAGFLAHKSYGGVTPTAILLTVLGQSNAIAAGTAAQSPPAGYSATPSNTKIWVSGTSSFDNYQALVNSDPKTEVGNAWGMELAFAQKLRDSGDTRPLFIHKWAAGGQALNVGWKANSGTVWNAWNTQRTSMLAALLAIHSSCIEIVIWNQGEADSRIIHADSYDSNYDTLLSTFRARDSLAASALWITQRIRPYSGDTADFPMTSVYTVRQAQEKARSNVRIIDQDFEPEGFASLHPGVSWVIECGNRCFQAYANNVTIGDTSPTNLNSINDVTGASLSTTVTSNEIAVEGIDIGSSISVNVGEYQVRNPDNTTFTAWTTSPSTVHPFQKISIRRTSSSSPNSSTSMVLTVGSATKTWNITTVSSSVSISGTPSSTGTVGQPYSFTPTVSGGMVPYTFALISGSLGSGMSFSTATGAITSSSLTGTGSYSNLIIRVTDNQGVHAQLGPFSITVSEASIPVWDSTVNNSPTPNTVYTNSNRSASTSAATTAIRTVRLPVASGKTTGKWYACAEFTGAVLAGRSFGLILQAPPPGGGTLGTNRWSWQGTSIGSNSASRTMPTNLTTVNGKFELAVDVDANLFWMRQAEVGANWNNDASADPSTGIGGLSCSARAANAIFVLGALPSTTTLCTITLVNGTIPGGYLMWN